MLNIMIQAGAGAASCCSSGSATHSEDILQVDKYNLAECLFKILQKNTVFLSFSRKNAFFRKSSMDVIYVCNLSGCCEKIASYIYKKKHFMDELSKNCIEVKKRNCARRKAASSTT
jgi:hypothetical protein